MPNWFARLSVTRASFVNSGRCAIAVVASLLLARTVLRLPEFYWAPLAAIVVILSTTPPLTTAWQRFVGTAVGVVFGAIISTFLPSNWIVYGFAIFICGLLCALLRIAVAHRFAAIALTIVVFESHGRGPWMVALHRFEEVSLGIAVALLLTLMWSAPS